MVRKKQWACNHKKPFRQIGPFLWKCPDCSKTITLDDKDWDKGVEVKI